MFDGIREDIKLAMERDPAATSPMSVWLFSPAMHAVWAYRRHHWLWTHGHKTLARMLATRTRRKYGVEIHPGATIGRRFIIDHGMGIVIGETTIIGDDCMLYQGVTLGGTGKETGKRHPTLGNNVMVGVNAVVLGNITIGDNAKIGGGTVVVHDVPPNSTVVGPAGHVVKRRCVAEEWNSKQISEAADTIPASQPDAVFRDSRMAQVGQVLRSPSPQTPQDSQPVHPAAEPQKEAQNASQEEPQPVAANVSAR